MNIKGLHFVVLLSFLKILYALAKRWQALLSKRQKMDVFFAYFQKATGSFPKGARKVHP